MSIRGTGSDNGMIRTGQLRPLASVKLGDEVTKNIRDAIMSGVYASGDKLSVAQIAGGLAVSTMPVREAMVALAHEGLLEPSAKGGFQVAPLERQDIEDIFLVHAFIATLLAERAMPLMDKRTMGRLKQMIDQVNRLAAGPDDERTRAKIESYNFQFHHTINKLVDAPRLHWFLRAATRYVPQHIYETLPAWTQLTIVEHPLIVEAFEKRDIDLVRQRVHAHVKHAGGLIVNNLEQRGFWSVPVRVDGPASVR